MRYVAFLASIVAFWATVDNPLPAATLTINDSNCAGFMASGTSDSLSIVCLASAPPPSPPPTGDPYLACASIGPVIKQPLAFGAQTMTSPGYGGPGFVAGAVYVGSWTIPKTWTPKNGKTGATVSASEFDGPPTLRYATVGTKPCDFTGPTSRGTTVSLNYTLVAGQTYYFTIRNSYPNDAGVESSTCASECDLIVTVGK